MSNIYQSKKHTEQNRKDRSESYFYGLRRYHNYIKRILYDTYTKNIDNLLELAIGKNGDMNKIIDNNVKNVVGYDIDSASIEEGKRRVKQYHGRNNTKFELHVLDLSNNIIKATIPFDVVSAQFSFHYFFKSKETFSTILESIKLNLKPGGYFIGTMFDGKSLLNLKAPESDIIELSDENQVRFRLKFSDKNDVDDIFGNKISVFIKDTVLDEPMDEYIVNFDSFVKLMKMNGFDLVESKLFNNFYESYNNNKLNSLQKEVSFLNRTFVFKYTVRKNSSCRKEMDYLTECDWSYEELKMIILYKYLKAFDNKIDTSNEETKEKLLYIKSNFLNPTQILDQGGVSDDIKNYYKHIYEMYLHEISKV